MSTMNLAQKMYWYDVGYRQAAEGAEEPEFGRMNKDEQACWWAGCWACRTGLPNASALYVALVSVKHAYLDNLGESVMSGIAESALDGNSCTDSGDAG